MKPLLDKGVRRRIRRRSQKKICSDLVPLGINYCSFQANGYALRMSNQIQLPGVLSQVLLSGQSAELRQDDIDYAFFAAWTWHVKSFGMVTPEIICDFEIAYPLYSDWSQGKIPYPEDFRVAWWEFYWWPAAGEVLALRELVEKYSTSDGLYSAEIEFDLQEETFYLKVRPELHAPAFDSQEVRNAVVKSLAIGEPSDASELSEIVIELITNENYLH